jgi:hypothetical protein
MINNENPAKFYVRSQGAKRHEKFQGHANFHSPPLTPETDAPEPAASESATVRVAPE